MDSNKITVGRVITFVGPYLSLLAGTVATYLYTHFPGLAHVTDQATAQGQIASALVFIVTAGVSWAVQHKWLSGQQAWESYIADPQKDVNADGTAGNIWDPSDDPFSAPSGDEGMGADDAPETDSGVTPDDPEPKPKKK